jgi:hypothetical protein
MTQTEQQVVQLIQHLNTLRLPELGIYFKSQFIPFLLQNKIDWTTIDPELRIKVIWQALFHHQSKHEVNQVLLPIFQSLPKTPEIKQQFEHAWAYINYNVLHRICLHNFSSDLTYILLNDFDVDCSILGGGGMKDLKSSNRMENALYLSARHLFNSRCSADDLENAARHMLHIIQYSIRKGASFNIKRQILQKTSNQSSCYSVLKSLLYSVKHKHILEMPIIQMIFQQLKSYQYTSNLIF